MKTNVLAIVVCGIVNLGIGMIWYMSFAQDWMAGQGLTEADAGKAGFIPFIVSFVGALVSAYLLSLIFQRMKVCTWSDGALSGAAAGLFSLTSVIVINLFALKPFTLSLIDGGYIFVLFVAYGAILGGWPKTS